MLSKIKSSIRASLVTCLGFGMLIISIFMISVIGSLVSKLNSTQITKSIVALTEKKADVVEKEMKEYVASVEVISGMVAGAWTIPSRRRRNAESIAMYSFIRNSKIRSAWALWMPMAFDKRDAEYADSEYHDDGRFRIRYVKTESGRLRTDEIDDMYGSWFDDAMNSQETTISEPETILIDGVSTLTAKVYSRILDYNSDPIGVAGIDIVLSSLEQILEGESIYSGTTVEFLTNSGKVMGSSDGENIGAVSALYSSQEFQKNLLSTEKGTVTFVNGKGHGKELVTIARIAVDRRENVPWYVIARTPMSEIQKTTKVTTRTVFMFFLLEIVVVLILILILCKYLINPLQNSVAALKNISEGDGDMTVRLKDGACNEIGLMAKSFNKTMEKIGTSIKDAKTESRKMKDIGDELSASMDDTKCAVEEIKSSIETVQKHMQSQSVGVEETRAVVTQIVKNIQNLTTNIESQAASVIESSSSIEQMTQNIDSVSKVLKKNRESIEKLEKSSEEGMSLVNATVNQTLQIQQQSETLGEASSVIRNIARQTNLLAMNAAIEAAHAGELGTGFAVVANEIRNLAEQSNSQGTRIQKALKDVQTSINTVSESSKIMQQQFTSILSMTKTVSEQERYIDDAMQQQNTGGRQILEAIKHINAITSDVKGGSSEMLSSSREVSEEMDKLAKMTDIVNESMAVMNEKNEAISSTSKKVIAKVAENLESVEKLNASMNKFKV